jgi:hypothetical protein
MVAQLAAARPNGGKGERFAEHKSIAQPTLIVDANRDVMIPTINSFMCTWDWTITLMLEPPRRLYPSPSEWRARSAWSLLRPGTTSPACFGEDAARIPAP